MIQILSFTHVFPYRALQAQ